MKGSLRRRKAIKANMIRNAENVLLFFMIPPIVYFPIIIQYVNIIYK
jgi:hypothetical protein